MKAWKTDAGYGIGVSPNTSDVRQLRTTFVKGVKNNCLSVEFLYTAAALLSHCFYMLFMLIRHSKTRYMNRECLKYLHL